MGKADNYTSEKSFRKDLTISDDHKVFQLTAKGFSNICQYFTHRSWLPDEKHLLFTSDRSGTNELYWVNVETGIITQLTENADIPLFNWAVSKDGSFVVYRGRNNANQYWKLLTNDFSEELICTRKAPYNTWHASIIGLDSKGEKFYTCCHNQPEHIPSNVFSGNISEGSFKPILPPDFGETHYIDHQMISPTNEDLMQINFTPKKYYGKESPQRMWLLEPSSGKFRPLYEHKRKWFSKERVGHESWLSDGKHLSFVVRRNKVKICNLGGGLEGERGHEDSWTVAKGPNFWHASVSPQRTWLVADTMWEDTGLWLAKLHGPWNNPPESFREGRIEHLCLTKSKWQETSQMEIQEKSKPVGAHPHPGWSPRGKFVHFTANTGKNNAAQLFLVSI